MLYYNLLDAVVTVDSMQFVIRQVSPAMGGTMHVCYASCCHGDMDCHHGDTLYAVGILSKTEVVECSDVSRNFILVSREEYNIESEVWAAEAACSLVLQAASLSPLHSALVIGDGDTLFEVMKRAISTRVTDVVFVDTSDSTESVLFDADTVDCAINISREKRYIDIMSVTKRCGRAVCFIRDKRPVDVGMASLLKNISVINIGVESVKDPASWCQMFDEMKNRTNARIVRLSEHNGDDSAIFAPVSLTFQIESAQSSLVRASIEKFFRHRPTFTLEFRERSNKCGQNVCPQPTTPGISDAIRVNVGSDDEKEESSVRVGFKLSPLSLRQWLWDTFVVATPSAWNGIYLFPRITE